MISLSLSLPHFPITIAAETSLSYPVISDWEEPCLEGKDVNWQTAFFYMNYNSGCFYLGIYLKKHRSYWGYWAHLKMRVPGVATARVVVAFMCCVAADWP